MSHLTSQQRYTIERLFSNHLSYEKIGLIIGKDKSVISREIKRNKNQVTGKYQSDLAQRKAEKRHKDKPKKIWFSQQMQTHVTSLLEEDLSP